ncbi:hypothetical protein HanIR_Chr04g0193481 [Helianthus annuus]|nr:hypothetical protein HanIR_Chr04g0193481 [Helianthus annuus]
MIEDEQSRVMARTSSAKDTVLMHSSSQPSSDSTVLVHSSSQPSSDSTALVHSSSQPSSDSPRSPYPNMYRGRNCDPAKVALGRGANSRGGRQGGSNRNYSSSPGRGSGSWGTSYQPSSN